MSSVALQVEIEQNPDPERQREVKVLLLLATETISLDARIVQRAKGLELAGYGAFDALHLSFAEAGSADALLTTDDRFVKRAGRAVGSPRTRVLNPVIWLQEMAV